MPSHLMSLNENLDSHEVNQHLAALISNAGAVKAIGEAVEGTLGPKGLDCMLIDQDGSAIVTNDGVTILRMMDVNHPAARVLIGAAEQQEELVGDGTTTATVIASTLITAGAAQVIKGVPVARVIEGIRIGVQNSLDLLRTFRTRIDDLENPVLERIAFIAAREHHDISRLVIEAARILGKDRLEVPGFKLADGVLALDGAESELIRGTIIEREPLNRIMPRRLEAVKVLILDDALEPLKIDGESLGTEAGFNQKLFNEKLLHENIAKLSEIGVQAIFTDRAISDSAEDQLTDLGILGVQRVARHEWLRLAEVTGARPVKRGSLAKTPAELEQVTGEAATIWVDEKFKHIKILGKPNQKYVTIIIGAQTREVVSEKERIAKDAASALQAAWQGGVVPGAGSIELAIAHHLGKCKLKGMASYGYDCVVEALKRPIAIICANAGFNPLEKVEEVLGALLESDSYSMGVNCDTGMIEDVTRRGIWDPYFVKYYAIKTAGEIAEAILRINTIIKMKETEKH
jgi:chaperonin GroEL (HSP60 family)